MKNHYSESGAMFRCSKRQIVLKCDFRYILPAFLWIVLLLASAAAFHQIQISPDIPADTPEELRSEADAPVKSDDNG